MIGAEVNDRIFSTAVDCSYDLVLPSTTLSQTLLPQLGVNFDEMYQSVLKTTLEVFATHNSASGTSSSFPTSLPVLIRDDSPSDALQDVREDPSR
jgi:urate oxidase